MKGSPFIHWWSQSVICFLVDQFKIVRALKVWQKPWGKDWVYADLEKIVDHLRQHLFHVSTRSSKVGVSIALKKPDSTVLIQQKIKAEQLENVLTLLGVYFMTNTKECIDAHVFNARQ